MFRPIAAIYKCMPGGGIYWQVNNYMFRLIVAIYNCMLGDGIY